MYLYAQFSDNILQKTFICASVPAHYPKYVLVACDFTTYLLLLYFLPELNENQLKTVTETYTELQLCRGILHYQN